MNKADEFRAFLNEAQQVDDTSRQYCYVMLRLLNKHIRNLEGSEVDRLKRTLADYNIQRRTWK